MPLPPLSLELSIEGLKAVARDLNKQSIPKLADVYLAGISLLYHLKVDQALLQQLWKEFGENALCPSPDKIPAMTAVINDVTLFRALLKCLQSSMMVSTTGEGDSTATERAPSHGVGAVGAAGRKRTLSISGETEWGPSKAMKLTHSPVPSARQKLLDATDRRRPHLQVRALSATILYTALQHLDHWPAPLMQAYADDCFGPRSWVDDETCQLLVANLALTHTEEPPPTNPAQLENAIKVAQAYRKFEAVLKNKSAVNDHVKRSTTPPQKRGSLSSAGSAGNLDNASSTSAPKQTGEKKNGSNDGFRVVSKDETSIDQEKRKKRSPSKDMVAPKTRKKSGSSSKKKSSTDGGSSSSGEDDEEVVVMSESDSQHESPTKTKREPLHSSRSDGSISDMSFTKQEKLYPVVQAILNLKRVRHRFFGENFQRAVDATSVSLLDRLDFKSKQNSGLLQTLPSFTAIPAIRSLTARNLEKWLQSPALAGLARALFSSTVNHMKNVDPPLKEDLEAIDSILLMRLKANQLNAHIENITAIASRIPRASVARHMYSKLFKDVLDSRELTSSDQLKMIGAIHRAISPQFSYDAMAESLLTFLANKQEQEHVNGDAAKAERNELVKKLRAVVRAIAFELGSSFDGCLLMDALLSFDVRHESWSARDEEDKARLMFQCVTLAASAAMREIAKNRNASNGEMHLLEKSLLTARKLLLKWCCNDYGPHCAAKIERKRNESNTEADEVVGAGIPDFRSALGPHVAVEKIPAWLNTMRCLLFMEEPGSPLLKRFIVPYQMTPDEEGEWMEEQARIQICYDHGAIVNDEMMWVILEASSSSEGGITNEMALQLLENLFECCQRGRSGSLRLSDPLVVWEMYNLVRFSPPKPSEWASNVSEGSEGNLCPPTDKDFSNVPRLAYPWLWWRVTMLSLIMCAASPDKIGALIWKEHPTLQALMKMVTSLRYRFPTTDCDDKARDEMKRAEQGARDEETRVAELLFLPPRKESKKTKKMGSRVSKRLQKQQQEKEVAAELAEANRRKKMLRAAQKTIMLWDPDGPARKPPRESAELLLAVESAFGLSEIFQQSSNPDFLLMTIGQTSRGAIERAYDWLIPIISKLPGTISRLPSNTSCFLLLRAYGTDGEERNQLKELSAPLLLHVKDSLKGKFGESDAVKAFDLLMSDVASHNADRRRYARRVLQDSLGDAGGSKTFDSKSSWMLNLLNVKHAKSMVFDAIKHMSTAAKFERGRVLRNIVMALERHTAFAELNNIKLESAFSAVLVQLISDRPSIYAEALDTFADFRSMVIRVVHGEFARYAQEEDKMHDSDLTSLVKIKLFASSLGKTQAMLPLPVLQSTCVLLSIWKDQNDGDDVASAVGDLVGALMRSNADDHVGDEGELGLASAKMCSSGEDAVLVESWIMLAKARSDLIAKRAALSAPEGFLPRLLLCSGLPRASLITMIDRLGRLGDKMEDKSKAFLHLLAPSASSEWDIGRVGLRRDIARKLLGRLSAYIRLNDVSLRDGEAEMSMSFIQWLSDECRGHSDKPKKQKSKKSKIPVAPSLSNIPKASSILASLDDADFDDPSSGLQGPEFEMQSFFKKQGARVVPPDSGDNMDSVGSFIEKCIKENYSKELDDWLKQRSVRHDPFHNGDRISDADIAVVLLRTFCALPNHHDAITTKLLKWIPVLSRVRASEELWALVFSNLASMQTQLDDLSINCVHCWSEHHIDLCTKWILSASNLSQDCCLPRVVKFLVGTSGIASVKIDSFGDKDIMDTAFGKSEEFIAAATSLALACFNQLPSESKELLSSMSDPPPLVSLLLLVGKCGKKPLQHVSESLLKALSVADNEETRHALQSIVLRLYLLHPFWMGLNSAEVRTALLGASEAHSSCWNTWHCALDDPVRDMLDALAEGDLRLAKPLADMSRKHPLIVLRKSKDIIKVLEADATVRYVSDAESRGLVRGQSLSGPCEAKLDGKLIKVTVLHWGYTYTEPLWFAFLDIMSGIPREVLFSSGSKIGLLDIIGLYLQLLLVQLQLRSAGKAARLKGKLSDFFVAYQQNNPAGWKQWLGTKVGESEVRHLLISCDFISTQQAIDSLKS